MYTIIQGSLVEKHTMFVTTGKATLFTTDKQATDVAKKLALKTGQRYYVVSVCACISTETNIVEENV